MNSLEQKHFKKIDNISGSGYDKGILDKKIELAKSCADISIEFAIGFNDFIQSNAYFSIDAKYGKLWFIAEEQEGGAYSTQQLIDKYIQSL